MAKKEFDLAKYYQDRKDKIKELLFTNGGEPITAGREQMELLIGWMIDDGNIPVEFLLRDITRKFEHQKQMLNDGAIFPVSLFYSGKEHMPYACLDKQLKFCVKRFGEDEWNDVLYVYPYMNVTRAFDIIEEHKEFALLETLKNFKNGDEVPYNVKRKIFGYREWGQTDDESEYMEMLKDCTIAVFVDSKKDCRISDGVSVKGGYETVLRNVDVSFVVDGTDVHIIKNRFGARDDFEW